MGIMSYIAQQKEKFKDAQFHKKAELAKIEAEHLKRERARQAELAKAQAEKVRLEKDVQRISAFTEQHKSESKGQRFAKGLANVVNKAKVGVTNAKKQGYFKGPSIGAPHSRSPGGGGLNTGTRNVFGSGGRDVFSGAPEKPRPKVTVIKIQQ